MAIAEFLLPTRPAPRSATQDIVDLAARALSGSEFGALRRIRCEFLNGCLTLRGTVSSYHLKQIAQTLVRDLPGVGRISNRVEVR